MAAAGGGTGAAAGVTAGIEVGAGAGAATGVAFAGAGTADDPERFICQITKPTRAAAATAMAA